MRIPAVMLTSAALVLPAVGQIGNPAGVDPATPQSAPGVPAPGYANTQDKLFARLAAAGGLAEVEFAKLAERKAVTPAVREFASRMIRDHEKSNQQLTTIAKQAGIPLPDQVAPEHEVMRTELEAASGRSFDHIYIQGQLVAHQKTVVLLQYEIGQGQNAELQRFAAETLPVVLVHLERARGLTKELAALVTIEKGSGGGQSTTPKSGLSEKAP